MSLIVCWVLFPLVATLVCVGAGCALERAARLRLPAPVLPAAGLAVVTVLATFTTSWGGGLAGATTPVVLVVAIAGYALGGWRRLLVLRARVSLAPALGALAVFAVFAAPVVLSGEATFLGYVKLDDTATWLAFMDQLMAHGRSFKGLPISTPEALIQINFGDTSYPTGAFSSLAVLHGLVGQDPAWVFQPWMTTLAAWLSLALYALAGGVVESRVWRAVAGAGGALSALLVGYVFWGGIKEVLAAVLIAGAVSLLLGVVRERSVRSVLPAAFAIAALLDSESVGAGVWIAPVLIGLAGGALYAWRVQRDPWPRFLLRAPLLAAATAVLAIPALRIASKFLDATDKVLGKGAVDIGNLHGPLRFLQVSGVWLNGDFRDKPAAGFASTLNGLLVAVVVLLAVGGVLWCARRGRWAPVAYFAACVLGAVVYSLTQGAWITGKALASASPALPFLALLAAGMGWEALAVRRGAEAAGPPGDAASPGAAAPPGARRVAPAARFVPAVLAGVVGAGLLASAALAYHRVTLAPRERLHELEHVGKVVAGKGPTLLTDPDIYGARHFLRRGDPEGASDLRRRLANVLGGWSMFKGAYADLDSFEIPGLYMYRTLVIRRSPTESRPISPYKLIYKGSYYEVWNRPAHPTSLILQHLALGDVQQRPWCGAAQQNGQMRNLGVCSDQAASVPDCDQVRRLALLARRRGGVLLAAPRPVGVVVPPELWKRPAKWVLYAGSEQVIPTGGGTATATFSVPRAGRYTGWIGGYISREVAIEIDGHSIGSLSDRANDTGQYERLATVRLSAGMHRMRLKVDGNVLAPGSSGDYDALRALILQPPSDPSDSLLRVAPADAAKRLCGRSFDWIEAVRGA